MPRSGHPPPGFARRSAPDSALGPMPSRDVASAPGRPRGARPVPPPSSSQPKRLMGAPMSVAAKLPSTSTPSDLADRIDADGYAVVEGYVPPHELIRAQDFVRRAVAENGGEYKTFSGSKALGGTFLERLPADPAFVDLCRGVYARATGEPPPHSDFYQILRCLSGSQAKLHSMRFHYDSYVLTALIPIVMPAHGSAGNLIILPSTRRIRRSYAVNVLDKLLVDNALAQMMLKFAYRMRYGRMVHLRLTPGNLYLFWGYRSLHTNEPCDPNELRSTALLHYADPHAGSGMKRQLRTRAS